MGKSPRFCYFVEDHPVVGSGTYRNVYVGLTQLTVHVWDMQKWIDDMFQTFYAPIWTLSRCCDMFILSHFHVWPTKIFCLLSPRMLQSVRRHSAIVFTVTINGMWEIHPVKHLLFNHSYKWLGVARFVDHIQWRITICRTPLDERSARLKYLNLTTHNTHDRQTSMPPVGFEHTISAGERPQTYALDRVAAGTGT